MLTFTGDFYEAFVRFDFLYAHRSSADSVSAVSLVSSLVFSLACTVDSGFVLFLELATSEPKF